MNWFLDFNFLGHCYKSIVAELYFFYNFATGDLPQDGICNFVPSGTIKK